MKQFLPIILFFASIGSLTAQYDFRDSLKLALLKPGLSDTIKIDLYNELSFSWAGTNPQIGLAYADSAKILSEKSGHSKRLINSINNFGVNYWYLGKDSMALEAYQKVLDYYKQQGELRGQGRVSNNMALISYNQGDYRQALKFHEVSNRIFEELNERKYLINSMTNTGVVFLAVADYPRALEYFLGALSKTDSLDRIESGYLNTNIGLVYKNLDQLDQAEKYYLEAIQIYEQENHQIALASSLGNLANVKTQQERFEDAKDLFQKALAINLDVGNQRRIASDYANLGVLYKNVQQLDSAMIFLEQAEKIYAGLNDALNHSFVLLEEAEVLSSLAHDIPSRWDLILRKQQKALELAIESANIQRQMSAYQGLAVTLEKLKRFDEALSNFKNYSIAKDSIFNDENRKKLTRMSMDYDYQLKENDLNAQFSKEREILELEQAKEKQLRMIYLVAFGILLVMGLILMFLIQKRNQAQKLKLKAEHKAQKIALELKALRSQINPHFIFNALNSISNFLLKNNPDRADYYLTKFSKLIRMILESSDQTKIPLSQELELLEHYVEIESMRLGKKIKLKISQDGDLELSSLYVPPLILQPFVENSIWHGIAKSDTHGKIDIAIEKKKGFIEIKIQDNGIGRFSDHPRTDKEDRKSMGIKITQERLELLMQGYEVKPPEIKWRDLEPGLEVGISVPV
jgi:tetratricopeptide (TPR) repeat protein